MVLVFAVCISHPVQEVYITIQSITHFNTKLTCSLTHVGQHLTNTQNAVKAIVATENKKLSNRRETALQQLAIVVQGHQMGAILSAIGNQLHQ